MMERKYSAAVFDVDGTLLDTTEGVLAAVRYTITEKGLEPLTDEQMLRFIGPPIQNSFREIYGLEGDILQELAGIFRNRYKDYELLKAVPYEGIYEVLDELMKRDIQIAVATYKRQDYAVEILKHFGFDRYSRILYGADHENKLKKVDIIKKCLDDLRLEKHKEAVMVGDSSHDAIGAEQIGVDFLGVTYGFEFRTEADVMKYKAAGWAESPLGLLAYIV